MLLKKVEVLTIDINLSDEVLIKDNHIKAARDLKKLVSRASKSSKNVTVEIENISQLKKILGLKFKRILFDNMNITQLKKCLKLCNKKYETEYSGNANIGNIKKISRTGSKQDLSWCYHS